MIVAQASATDDGSLRPASLPDDFPITRTDSRPAAVLFGATEMALAAARSLRPRGVQVFALHFAGQKPLAAHSRFVRFVQGPDLQEDQAVLEFLLKFAERFAQRPVLIPAQDQAVLFLHRHRGVLAGRYRFYVWESDLLPEIGSKCKLAEVAQWYRLPAPRTLAPQDRAALEAGIARLRFPCLVKPEYTNLWWTPAAAALGLNKKAIQADNAEQLRDIYDRSRKIGSNVVIQQLVVGPDSGHMSYVAFVAPDGEIKAEMVARKLRIHAPRFGVGCYLESAADTDAIHVGREIIRRLGYRGFTSLQFKRDARDRQLYLLEINLRFPVWIGLPIACGLDFPFIYYQTCVGQPYFVPGDLALGRRWMDLRKDFVSMRTYAREGTWTWRQWASSLLARPVFAFFRWSDPLPSVVSTAHWLGDAIKLRLRRLFGASNRSDQTAAALRRAK
jgi:D-aspartate ligase